MRQEGVLGRPGSWCTCAVAFAASASEAHCGWRTAACMPSALRSNVAADGNIARGLPRLGQILGQASVALEELPVAIDKRDQCDRHLEDAGELRDDAVENRLGFGVEQLEFGERGESFLFVCAYRRLGHHFWRSAAPALAICSTRIGQRGDHFIRAGIARTLGCLGHVFRRAPQSPITIFTAGNAGAHFLAQISRVDHRRRRYN